MSGEEYYKICQQIYELIQKEITSASNNIKELPIVYAKLVIMYEFYRLLRGEAFLDIRPSTGENQKEIYRMEADILQNLNSLKSKLDPNDARTKSYIELAKKNFDL